LDAELSPHPLEELKCSAVAQRRSRVAIKKGRGEGKGEVREICAPTDRSFPKSAPMHHAHTLTVQ